MRIERAAPTLDERLALVANSSASCTDRDGIPATRVTIARHALKVIRVFTLLDRQRLALAELPLPGPDRALSRFQPAVLSAAPSGFAAMLVGDSSERARSVSTTAGLCPHRCARIPRSRERESGIHAAPALFPEAMLSYRVPPGMRCRCGGVDLARDLIRAGWTRERVSSIILRSRAASPRSSSP